MAEVKLSGVPEWDEKHMGQVKDAVELGRQDLIEDLQQRLDICQKCLQEALTVQKTNYVIMSPFQEAKELASWVDRNWGGRSMQPDGSVKCIFCEAQNSGIAENSPWHYPTCITLKARALLQKLEDIPPGSPDRVIDKERA